MNETYHSQPVRTPELLERLQSPQPTVIAFEGGPCGGKTTIVNKLLELSGVERQVVVLPEAATQHIEKLQQSGLTVGDLIVNDHDAFLRFEADVLGTIVDNIETAKRDLKGTDALIIADRSDIGAYLSAEDYQTVLRAIGRTRPPHLDLVDKMVYLPTLAREDADRYDELLSTNTARYETAEEAVRTCERNLAAVAMHPELSIFWGGDFEDKVRRVIKEVMDPEREVEAKYGMDESVLSYDSALETVRHLTGRRLARLAIRQSYHESGGQEYRLRDIRMLNDELETNYGRIYHFAVKTGSGADRRERRRNLTAFEYAELYAEPKIGELQKIRDHYLYQLPDTNLKSQDYAPIQTILSADYYAATRQCFVEIEGIEQAAANDIRIPGFLPSSVSARELV